MDGLKSNKNEVDTMEEAINTETDFLKFVNELPIFSEVNPIWETIFFSKVTFCNFAEMLTIRLFKYVNAIII